MRLKIAKRFLFKSTAATLSFCLITFQCIPFSVARQLFAAEVEVQPDGVFVPVVAVDEALQNQSQDENQTQESAQSAETDLEFLNQNTPLDEPQTETLNTQVENSVAVEELP